MNVKELIAHLKQFDQTKRVLVSCDEELNTLFKGFQVANLDETDIVFYGLSGSEVEWNILLN